MSFILDALRKSEHERQRGAVPGVTQVPFATPQRGVPRWTLAVIVALIAALLTLGAAWWQSSRERPADIATTAARTVAPLELPPEPVRPAPEPVLPAPLPAPRATRAEPPPDEAAAQPPQRGSVVQLSGPAAVRDPAPRATSPSPESTEPPLPSAMALAAQGVAVPQLRLELFAFSETPAERFAFINGVRYREGETLRDGPRLVSIERGGAVLSLQGRRFLLSPE